MNDIESISRQNCTGCMMCGDLCPKQAISFPISRADSFWYPVIDHKKCISCGKCYQRCPSTLILASEKTEPIVCYGAKSRNEEVRANSTSGGVFSELAYKWIGQGGVCVGAEYDLNQRIFHAIEKDDEGVKRLRQSKYAQSDTSQIYLHTKKALTIGTLVMFCGTPCQVAALKSFLGREYENLITIDFVCCGICSAEVYRQYLASLKQKYGSTIIRVWFKNKELGWRQLGTRIDFLNGQRYYKTGSSDPYMAAFVTDGLSMRECCEHCQYRKVPHISDLTLADFWGIEKIRPDMDDNKGISSVMVNSKKGKRLFDSIVDSLDYFETSVTDIAAGNFTVFEAKKSNSNRTDFLKTVIEQGFSIAIKKYSSCSGKNKIRTNYQFYKILIKKQIMDFLRR